jgi:hypothetical protein
LSTPSPPNFNTQEQPFFRTLQPNAPCHLMGTLPATFNASVTFLRNNLNVRAAKLLRSRTMKN